MVEGNPFKVDDHDSVLLWGQHVGKIFGHGKDRQTALDDVSVEVRSGECLALIGGSGSGKSTLTRIVLGLDKPTSGTVTFEGEPVDGRKSAGYEALRQKSSLVFQSPFSSLDPRWTVAKSVAEPLKIQRNHSKTENSDADCKVRESLSLVGLDPDEFLNRYPVDLSGGQAQRVAIARALITDPELIVADEPMSAIDVAARLQILEAFAAIRKSRPETAIIMISHDLGVVQHIADRIVVLHDGKVVEGGSTDDVLNRPKADYTRDLVAAASL
ncbi:dipeptide/oligopeptide/nickel ABC transporter ATP-binding protein [Bifidobacterium sp. ESL0745]|uniref:ABC transporter ATP-binding protein n=1 Tax=Bifidobacterium sp. ESL0745 TaxID=2983226 RepID=UPI0023F952FF|nr:dipeptide/oligopeptide/nickel ABC transporter ATP-binding protein [Bifidobacterium sp. ESL0745]MDF7665306.1 dipeptide/oligopeptide/nickel ABC transporter ATP-binding protein [Bifidobacterium sp. ESL0745]